jgi:hypothetical protein
LQGSVPQITVHVELPSQTNVQPPPEQSMSQVALKSQSRTQPPPLQV